MNPLPPNVFKPLTEEQIKQILKQYAGKEAGVQLEDVLSPEELERVLKKPS